MTALTLSPDLRLPADAVTQTFGILAVRGAGKSNTAAVMAEEMFAAKLPFVVVDPVGSWWGLRSAGDGRGPGLAVPIFGGRHGDVPLERAGGPLLADLVVDERLSCVLDVSELSEGDKTRFLIDFGERLYRRNQDPLHLFLEEADDYCPQKPFREQARLLRVWENIVRRGRARGLGITMLTQRSAVLNKSVLTQIETLMVLRTTSPQDRKAIAAWVDYHGQSSELLESLPSLKDGEAWVWSPHWLGRLIRVQIRRRSTFDSGATPKQLTGKRAPATLADIDLGAITQRMAATIERAKQDDPAELRKKIHHLEAENRKLRAQPAPKAEEKRVEVPVLSDQQLGRIEKIVDHLHRFAERLDSHACILQAALRDVRQAAKPSTAPQVHRVPQFAAPARSRAVPVQTSADPATPLGAGERKMLTAIGQHATGVTREQLTVLTGYKRSSRDTYLQRLTQRGLAVAEGGQLRITEAGLAVLGPFEPLPTGSALCRHWLERLPQGERVILEGLCQAWPHAVTRERIGEITGYQRSSRDTYLQRLAARRLIVVRGRGEVQASPELFDDPIPGGSR